MESVQRSGDQMRLAEATDDHLLSYMKARDEDPSAAKEAWAEFYRRHAEYLYRVCRRAYGGTLGEAGVRDLVQDAFIRAYEKAATFDSDGLADADKLRLRARAWLGKIALNLLRTMLRGQAGASVQNLEEEAWENVPEQTPAASSDSAESRLVRDALGQLSEKEQHVLRVTFQWYQLDKPHQRLPNEVVAELARTLGTTPANIRQLRSRALKKIQQYVQANLHAEE
jgi:RNA polymerase sigma factor (sigma-70 family)